MIQRLLPIVLISLMIASCDAGLSGELKDNIPPKTFLTFSDLSLPDDERLVSQIRLSWWGDDPDGYVVGYELLIGEESESSWSFTTRTDSVFVLPIEEGNQTADVRFSVRAIDNKGAHDPDPPVVVFPIVNSPPNISFNSLETPPDTTFRIVSFGWIATDPDGQANLNRIEIALNDTTNWSVIPIDFNLITLRVNDEADPPTARVLLGRSAIPSDIYLDPVLLDAENTLFIRAVDNAGARSEVREESWYLKKQRSRILFIHDYEGTVGAARVAQHMSYLKNNGFELIDFLDLSAGTAQSGQRIPFSNALHNRALVDPTINLMFAEWDHIYWLSNSLDRNIGYALEMTLRFFQNGGTMFINIPTDMESRPDDNPLFQFLPFEKIAGLPPQSNRFQIEAGTQFIPDESIVNPPVMTFRRRLIANPPVFPFSDSIKLFEAEVLSRSFTGALSPYTDTRLFAVTNPDESVLFVGVDLSEFTPESDFNRFIELTCKEILGFQQ
jgi:hypothetical protein